MFSPELAELVCRRQKTVTRRLVSENPRSPWYRLRCRYTPGACVKVQPGRGKPHICRVVVVDVRRELLRHLTDEEAVREGFADREEFFDAWLRINGSLRMQEQVWRIEFVRVED